MTVDIIGGGIGGLTTAIALEQKGIKTSVFEQAEKIKPVGAGIILANNAMQVFEKLGLRQIIQENGNPISSMNITKPNLKPLSKVDLTFFEEKYGVKNIAIHRGTLQQILMDQLNPESLILDRQLKKVQQQATGHLLEFQNGITVESSTLIGADGIQSKVRQNLFPNGTIRNANQICWRGVTSFELPKQYRNELNEAWGKSARFGFVEIAENTVYWYALKAFKQNKEEFSIADIESHFSEYSPLVKDLISATKKEAINTAEILDLKPIANWHKENVCLIGDAAHATTPNMGQGACQAIEDGYILAACMRKQDKKQAFEEFQKLRLPKAQKVVNMSWKIGKIAHVSNPVLRAFRNQIIRLTPSSVNRKQSEQIFELPTV